ncbi:MAG: hypothetical protein NUV32_02110 [Exilispira sp.]|jgi:hypothetical protein|nr:hypothetical protein [Exilispira sp.]
MKKNINILFLIFSLSMTILSSNFYISPKSPYAGQVFTLSINLYQYGIFNIDPSKSFVKTTNPYINIISYKISEKDNKYYLKIRLQLFLTGIVDLSDLIFFDGNSYYNFSSISFQLNSNIKEFYILPYLKKFQKFYLIRFFIFYLLFILISFTFIFLFHKIKKYYSSFNKSKKEKAFLLNNLKKLNRIKNELTNDFISEIDFKQNLIHFTSILSELLDSNLKILNHFSKIDILDSNNSELSSFTYKSEKDIFESKNRIISSISFILNELNNLLKNEYGKH